MTDGLPLLRRRGVAPLIVAAVAILGYLNALANGFALDDRFVVLTNPIVESLSGLWRAWNHPYWPNGPGQYRPLVIAGFSFDWAISGGSARWFHLVNLLWHAAACVAVWALLAELAVPVAALGGALVFALHPVHVEAVSNVVGRAECMATFFVVAAVLAHRRDRAGLAALLFALGLASKENAIVFLGLAAAHDLLLRPPYATDGGRTAWLDPLVRRWRPYAGYALVTAVYAAVLVAIFHDQRLVAVHPVWITASTSERLASVAGTIPEYVRLLVMPLDLAYDYAPWMVDVGHGITIRGVVGLGLVAVLGALIVATWRREPRTAYALLWVVMAISPVANVLFPSGVIVAERTLYLPSVGVALLAAVLLERAAATGRLRVAALATAALLAVFAVRGWTRTPLWKNNRVLFLELHEKHPESYRAHHFIARVYASAGDYRSAAIEYSHGIKLYGRDADMLQDAAIGLTFTGDLAGADSLLGRVIALVPNHPSAYLDRADVRFAMGDFRRAYANATRAFELAPDSARAPLVAGLAAQRIGDPGAAEAVFRRGLARHARDWQLHTALGQLLLSRGDSAGARREAAEAVRLAPEQQAAPARELLQQVGGGASVR
ncbi:MAG TPA: hypothetical protein VKA84_05520 [Gemmatimonadaceae bacterium]|nr:hypothetical protein [Gemmatimonadaceae bacterium]